MGKLNPVLAQHKMWVEDFKHDLWVQRHRCICTAILVDVFAVVYLEFYIL